MKLKNTLFILLLLISINTKAQNYVTIPDANFVNWLNTYYPTCMNGNQMDTTCSAIINEEVVYISNQNITDLTGINYFSNLHTLNCISTHLTNIPALPNSLHSLVISSGLITSLPTLPDSLIDLDCSGNNLTSLPTLPNSMENLNCQYNNLTSLPALPNFISFLKCGSNQLTSLPVLPDSLQSLYCDRNMLTTLPTLPNSLVEISCETNQITSLPVLPNSLQNFSCRHNLLTSLPALPNSLINLFCTGNQLSSLPTLPSAMLNLECYDNQLTNLPSLPDSLHYLQCGSNLLTSIPALSNCLRSLKCQNNLLTSLPALQNNLKELFCSNNQLTSLPALPNSLEWLWCNSNNISCFPVFPNSLTNSILKISSNPFTCLPNYISNMDAATLAYPLCELGDTLYNPNGCIGADGITGFTYKDMNTNCLKDAGDDGLINIPLKLYDNNNNLLAQMCSHGIGGYKFVKLPGTYKVSIDTTAMPFMLQCSHPGIDTTVTITTANPLASNINFALACKPGLDVGVQSVVANGLIFPGMQYTLKVFAGSMGQWYNLGCGAGVSGQVVVTVNGSATYIGPAPGAITPSVSGNVYTYNIANFDNVVNAQDFALNFSTNTFSLMGDSICVDVSVTPTVGDINPGNNTYHSCFIVFNSLDPNMKEVYPVNVLPGYDGYFTYTIHFQNTGNAPANNIFLVDTLSSNLDMETFKVINYSHNNISSLTGNVLTFRFPNIMLPDSTSDEPGSIGFVQYKIKPKGAIAAGTQIKNTAYIYFDYNAPIATNTTINEFSPLSIEEHSESFHISIYPNPVQDNATLVFTTQQAQHIQIKVLDMLGQEILLLNQNVNSGTNSILINTSTLAKGVYMLSVRDGNGDVRSVKFVK